MYLDTLAYQTREFFYSLGFGFILGILYDLTRILRLSVYNGRKKYFLFDILFAVSAAFLSMIFSLGLCRGKFAFYVVLGMTVGFAVHRLTLGQIFKQPIERFSSFIQNAFSKIFEKTETVFKLSARKIVVSAKKFKNKDKKRKKKLKKDLKDE